MTDNRKRIKEYYDSIEMSEDFCEKMKKMTAETVPPKKSRSLFVWKPTIIAVIILFVCMSSYYTMKRNGVQFPSPPTVIHSPTENIPSSSHDTEPSGDFIRDSTQQNIDETDTSFSSELSSAESQPIEQNPANSQSTEPWATDSQPTESQPSDPQPTNPQPTEPRPTDPQPTEPQPTDPQPTEPPPTDPQPTEPQPTDPPPTEPQPTDPPPTDPPPTEPTDDDPDPEDDLVLQASYTHTDTNDYIVITNTETGETETIDVTGKVNESGFTGTYNLFGCYVYVELIPDGNGGFIANARII